MTAVALREQRTVVAGLAGAALALPLALVTNAPAAAAAPSGKGACVQAGMVPVASSPLARPSADGASG